MRHKPGARTLCALAMSITVAMGGAAIAIAGERSDPSVGYRYAGVVENGRGAPAHYIVRGDGVRLIFFDAQSQGIRSRRYAVCLGPAGKSATRCWNRTARYGLGRLIFSATLPPEVPFGALTARWTIENRTVATWRFLHVIGP
jgi:hypothetical protein